MSKISGTVGFGDDNQGNGGAGSDVDGEYYGTGSFTALVPDGWKAFPVTDIWAEDPNTLDSDKLQICKGGETEWDIFSKPYVQIDNYREDDYTFCVCAAGEGGEDYMTYKLTVKEHVHEFSEWMITTEPTCTEIGHKIRECNCGKEDREDIPAAGHSWDEDGDALICTVCGKTIGQMISQTDAVSSDASESDKNAGALLPDNTPSQKEENKGMPWWGILLIALGAAAAGVGGAYVIFLKNNGGSGNYYTRDDYRRRNYGREPYDRGNYGRGQGSYDDGQYGYDEYEDGSYDDVGYDNSPRGSYGNDSYGRNGYRPDSNGRRNNNRP